MTKLLKDGVTIEKYSKLSQSEIREKIKEINFNNNKSKFISLAAKKILEEHDGVVPDTLKGLTSFKGIGNKVANIILQVGFGKSIGVAVDVHVHRISNRLKFVESKKPDETMHQLNEIFDKEQYGEVNKVLVGFGQLVCFKNKPKCSHCPIMTDCEIGRKELEKSQKKKKTVKGRRRKRVGKRVEPEMEEEIVDIEDCC